MKSFSATRARCAPQNRITEILTAAFAPTHLEVRDFSAQHRGHAESLAHGGGHYAVTIVADYFRGLNRLARHRVVYQALHNELRDAIHALKIAAYTPEEWM